MTPSSDLFDQSTLTRLLEYDPLVQAHRAFFALLDWTLVDDWQGSVPDADGHPILRAPTSKPYTVIYSQANCRVGWSKGKLAHVKCQTCQGKSLKAIRHDRLRKLALPWQCF